MLVRPRSRAFPIGHSAFCAFASGATEPDDPNEIVAAIRPLLGRHELAVVEHDDIEVTLDVHADGVFAAARIATDRVQSALGESSVVASELLTVEVEGIFPWASDGPEL